MSNTTKETKNTSGHGAMAEIPLEIRGWSWGGFLLTWIWGIGNSTYRAFWCFVPFVGFFMRIALGIKGREWAWRHQRWDSVEHFKRVQKKWTIASLILLVVTMAFYVFLFLSIFVFATKSLNQSQPTQMALQQMQTNSQVQDILGSSIHRDGSVSGSVNSENGSGSAKITIPVAGSNGQGKLHARACKTDTGWHIYRLVFTQDDSNTMIALPSEDRELCD